ncbi:MAG: hypothetical protein Kow0020_00970 [Wenzhouxiangellaceae bacterium]
MGNISGLLVHTVRQDADRITKVHDVNDKTPGVTGRAETGGDDPQVAQTGSAGIPLRVRPPQPTTAREIGGRKGPEPTRFGDWEKNGRCIDF